MAFSKAVRWIVLVLFALCAVFLAVNSFLFTCEITPRETTEYLTDAPWAHLAALAALIGLGTLLARYARPLTDKARRRLTVAVAAAMLLGLTACVLVSRSTPVFDQAACASAAYSTGVGAYTHYRDGQYLTNFPFQVPFVLFCTPLSLLTGADNTLALQLMNVAAIITMVWALADGAALLTGDRNMALLCWIGCFCFFPLWFYSTFVYGTLAGGAFMLLGARQLFLYLKDHRRLRMLWLGLFLTLACLLKMNYLIAMIAAGLLLLADSLETRRVFPALAALCVALACAEAGPLVVDAMEKRSGGELSQGFPTSSWIMLGLQEGDRSPGWYNENGYDYYSETGGNRAETDERCKAVIRERLDAFAKDPGYALSFFYRKTVSQWNEPSFQSLWVNAMMRGQERSALVLSLYEGGKAGKAMLRWMEQYQWLLYAGLCLWALFCGRKAALAELFFPLLFLGGFLFHMVWEGKSQYILIYVFCVIPYAVAGYGALVRRLAELSRPGALR